VLNSGVTGFCFELKLRKSSDNLYFGCHEGKLETFAKICVAASLETAHRSNHTCIAKVRDKRLFGNYTSKISRTVPAFVHIVFGCSCRSLSLNDCLHVGPPFLNYLCGIQICFWQHNSTFSSDIEKAFLHVHLDLEDRLYLFSWLSDPFDANSTFDTFKFIAWSLVLTIHA